MTWGGISYLDVMSMPVDRVRKFLDWKHKYDQEYGRTTEDLLGGK